MATTTIDLPLFFGKNIQAELDQLSCPATVCPPKPGSRPM